MIKYDDIAKVTCVDNGQTIVADILDFKPQVLMSVSLEKKLKVVLKYNTRSNEYQGELYGRTFVSKGPKETHYSTGRG
jgi:hypothetical protein